MAGLSPNDLAVLLSDLRTALLHHTMAPHVHLFEAAGCSAPVAIWNPGPANLRHPSLRRAQALIAAGLDRSGRLPLSWLDGPGFAEIADNAMVLEPIEGGEDFGYLHYGKEIAAAYGRDMTGERTSVFGGHIAPFFLSCYQAVMIRGEPIGTVHEPPAQVFVRVWRRLIQPLFGAQDGPPERLLGVNVADNALRAGLDALPDPVFVVDGDGIVCFGNRAATRMFGEGRPLGPRVSLAEALGCEIDLPASPDGLVRQGTLHEHRKALVRHTLLVAVRVTVGATYYRHSPFYIVTVQPED